MIQPRFSVVIPTHNNSATLVRAIESVLSQTWPAHEIILVDDASTDDVLSFIKQFDKKVRYFALPMNQGVSSARNFGARQASGDWISFLDADDWYYPDRLRMHAEWIQEMPDLDFLTGDYEYRDDGGEFISRSMENHMSGISMLRKAAGRHRVLMDRDDEFEAFVADHFGDTHTLSLPVETFHKLGGYPPGFKVCEDVHFLARLVARSRRAGILCIPLAVYCIHSDSATRRDPVKAQRENVRTLKDLAGYAKEFPGNIKSGYRTRLLQARYDLGSALIKKGQRGAAVYAVLPSLIEQPGWKSLRNLLSMLKG